jgi:hypothetical protein
MQQRDSSISLEVAKQSTKIAVASKRDSSAMKAIAVLTMVFLPATAVAVGIFLFLDRNFTLTL